MSLSRRVHIIKPNDTTRVPHRFVVFDTETRSQTSLVNGQTEYHKMFLWCASYFTVKKGIVKEQEKQVGLNGQEFWEWIASKLCKRETLWIFAHNLPFDLTVSGFWYLCLNRTYEITRYVIEDPPTIIYARHQKGRIRCVDTLNYWPMALEQLGQAQGCVKLRMPQSDAEYGAWIEYCRQDVAILAASLSRLISAVAAGNLGNFQPTASGIAWSAYRHKFYHTPIVVHDNESAIALERGAYYGGKCEVWKLGKVSGPVYVLDINSLYPYIMHQYRFPRDLFVYRDNGDMAILTPPSKDCEAVAIVRIKSPYMPLPCRRNGETLYAIGDFDTYLCGPELKQALDYGAVVKCFAAAWYKVAYIFQDFVEHYAGLKIKAKADGNAADEMLAKLCLNSLSGKFAQRSALWEACHDVPAEKPFGSWVAHGDGTSEPIEYRSLGFRVQKKSPRGEWYDSMPAISAWITSHGRVYMEWLRQVAGKDQCYYTDTDSLHVSELGYRKLLRDGYVHPTAIGRLKVVQISSQANYYGWKDYETDLGRTTVGIKKSAIVTPNKTWLQPEFEKLVNMTAHYYDAYVAVKERELSSPRFTVKGYVEDDGWITPPILSLPVPPPTGPYLPGKTDTEPHSL